MIHRRPSLTYAGGDVALVARLPCGRVRVVYVDQAGVPTRHQAAAWPHELRGLGWHLAEVKAAIAALPDPNAPPAPAPRALLYAHHVADHQRED